MLDERLGLVLNEQIDGVNPGVDQVAEHEIHDSVAGTEGHRGLGAFLRQRMQPRSLAITIAITLFV